MDKGKKGGGRSIKGHSVELLKPEALLHTKKCGILSYNDQSLNKYTGADKKFQNPSCMSHDKNLEGRY